MSTRYNWMADTDSKAFEVLNELQRKMTPGEKLASVLQMSEMMLRGYEDLVRKEFPDAGQREIFLRAAARRLGRETVIRAYGWDLDSGIAP
jgi:hypothetical protein